VGDRVLIPLASHDFDVTEVVVPWDALRKAGAEVVFATEDGQPGQCDQRLLTSVIFGQLGARPENVALYRELELDPAFLKPLRWADLRMLDYRCLILHGGHAPRIRQFLESAVLQEKVRQFWALERPLGAICHGNLLLARTVDLRTEKSIIAGRRMTCLTRMMERSAYWLTAWKLGRYYRPYDEWCEDEVRRALGPGKFESGPLIPSYDNPFVVEDGNLITGRWPGDARAAVVKHLPAKISGCVDTGLGRCLISGADQASGAR